MDLLLWWFYIFLVYIWKQSVWIPIIMWTICLSFLHKVLEGGDDIFTKYFLTNQSIPFTSGFFILQDFILCPTSLRYEIQSSASFVLFKIYIKGLWQKNKSKIMSLVFILLLIIELYFEYHIELIFLSS